MASLWINRFYVKKSIQATTYVFFENFIITRNKYFSKKKYFISFYYYSKILF